MPFNMPVRGINTILVEKHKGFVIYKARKQHQKLILDGITNIELDDLIQEGYCGLLDAAKTYDPLKSVEFITFAAPRIEGAIQDYLRSLDPLTQRARAKIKNLDKVKDGFKKSFQREPTPSELAKSAGMSEEEVRKIDGSRIIMTYTNPKK